MKEIYVIYVSNNLDYESYEEHTIGYVETEQEAENACKKFEEEALEDRKLYWSLENKCETCDKRCGCCTPCELQKQLQELEEKDIHAGCWHVGEGSYFYQKIKKL